MLSFHPSAVLSRTTTASTSGCSVSGQLVTLALSFAHCTSPLPKLNLVGNSCIPTVLELCELLIRKNCISSYKPIVQAFFGVRLRDLASELILDFDLSENLLKDHEV